MWKRQELNASVNAVYWKGEPGVEVAVGWEGEALLDRTRVRRRTRVATVAEEVAAALAPNAARRVSAVGNFVICSEAAVAMTHHELLIADEL